MFIILLHVITREDSAIIRVHVYKLRIFVRSFANAVANVRIVSQDVDVKLNVIQNSAPVT